MASMFLGMDFETRSGIRLGGRGNPNRVRIHATGNRSLHMLRPILRRLPLPIELIISTQKELLNLRGPPVGISSRRQVSRLAE